MAESARNVLVVDDDRATVELVCMAVGRMGHETRKASNGREALAEIAGQRPDLVIMDVEMPVMDGLEAVRAIRANTATASLPVILLTGLASDADTIRGVAAGATMYLTKPVDLTQLSRLLKAILH